MHTHILRFQSHDYSYSVIIMILLWICFLTHFFMAGRCFPRINPQLFHAFHLFIILFLVRHLILLLKPLSTLVIINHNFVSATMLRQKKAAPEVESPSQPRDTQRSQTCAPAQLSARKAKNASSTAQCLDTPPSSR